MLKYDGVFVFGADKAKPQHRWHLSLTAPKMRCAAPPKCAGHVRTLKLELKG